ncbi:MAG: thiamine pyrophosphate-binding protein [Desulfarculaceae bacterium]|nr:thiamine pyrophosphate-binding protein [Desulfarculaceae bacterium]MCF8071968.1 thiamine pyrophosphate-binding protein [Desulfarculaceae bacterium]MCF8101485.1 thiamine pyrophosphate-binding protein [Desulfarculaceae bacterium]MCF8115035.1 thiamine pyrophosphate-binding protein [Desulfarculaceae bacterium]
MAAADQINGAQVLAETIKGYGITHVFYVEAILRQTMIRLEELGIKRIVTHAEKSAAYMADGMARITRKPAVCMAQSVGAGNLAAGLQEAWLAHSPVVAITGQKQVSHRFRNAYQEVYHRPYYEPVTKYNVEVNTLEQLPLLLRQAFREATAGCPGPAHIDIYGILGDELERATGEFPLVFEERYASYPPERPAPAEADLAKAAQALERAARPVVVAGSGAVISGAGPEILALAEKLAMPIAYSVDGNGLVPPEHPLCLGPVGTYSRWCANQAVSEADLVLFVGSGTGDQVTNMWKIPRPGTPVIEVNIEPSQVGVNYPNLCSLIGDAKVAVGMLASAVSAQRGESEWSRRAADLVRAWREELEPLASSDDLPIRPERLCREITKALPENAVLVSCTGNSAIWSGTMIELTKPGQSYIRATGGSLGWAFPASMGIKCGAPDRPVVCFTGDGGLYYHLSELETAARWDIPVVVVVNNNGGYGQCLRGIRGAYGDRPGRKEDQYLFNKVNLSQVARELGCNSERVETPERIGAAINEAIASGRPSLVEVMTDIDCLSPVPWQPAWAR